MGAIATGPGGMLAALALSDVIWALLVAVGVWLAGWGIISSLDRSRLRARRPGRVDLAHPRANSPEAQGAPRAEATSSPESPSQLTDELPLATLPVRDAGDVAGILRWLVAESDAEAAGYMTLAPGGTERFVVEPRGLQAAVVGELAEAARRSLLGPRDPIPAISTTRWLGGGGSKALVLKGGASGAAEDPLRFARFAIELLSARRGQAEEPIEQHVRSIAGVAWAEMDGDSIIRILPAEGTDRGILREAVRAALQGTRISSVWMDEGGDGLEPRARLVDVTMDVDGSSMAEVSVEWGGQALRGRGHGTETHSGRYRAAADAMADALGPLLAGRVSIEGLYAHSHADEGELIVVVVSLDEEQLVGAVRARAAEEGASAARAVLDAVNRRLGLMAGGSGRI